MARFDCWGVADGAVDVFLNLCLSWAVPSMLFLWPDVWDSFVELLFTVLLKLLLDVWGFALVCGGPSVNL